MISLDKINEDMPLTFYATVIKKITEPEMIKLSRQMDIPNLLVCTAPLSGAARAIISDPVAVSRILTWLRTSKLWRPKIEETLQELAQDVEGRPLLSAFMPISELVMLGVDLHANSLQDIRATFEEWQAMGADEGSFEGYDICSGSLERAV